MLLNKIIETCQLMRCGHHGAANEALSQVLGRFDSLISSLNAEQQQWLGQLLPVMLDAQQRGDWIYLADILQYEVTKVIPKDF